jgi:hypothetical protein
VIDELHLNLISRKLDLLRRLSLPQPLGVLGFDLRYPFVDLSLLLCCERAQLLVYVFLWNRPT